MLDIKAIRKDFPILSRKVYGKPLVYLDNAATSQKPFSVLETITGYYQNYNSNVHRGVHALSMEATEHYEAAREKVAAFIGAPNSDCLIFVRGTTEGINLVASSWAIPNLGPEDEILLSEMEHHSNLIPWQRVSQITGAILKFIPVTPEGTLELKNLPNLINNKTKLVSITHVSNVL